MPITRRSLLSGATGMMAGVAGCLGEVRRAVDREGPDQVSIEILTLPQDADLYALQISNHLADNLREVGLQVDVVPTRKDALLREILLNQNYDFYVWRHPGQWDPDFIRSLLHSRFVEEPGWQNPFGYSNTMIDELLESQLATSFTRDAQLRELQQRISEEFPIIPIAFEDEHRILRSETIQTGGESTYDDLIWILNLQVNTEEEDPEENPITCRLGITDWRITQNLNPIAVEYRGQHSITSLLYDSLARKTTTGIVPWLANRTNWVSPENASAPTIEIELRSNLSWHDGEPLTAQDVAFTYTFLNDTSMTDEDPSVPAPRFRGRVTLVDSIEAVDDQVIRIQFTETSRDIALRALTVPIFPEHIWEEHTGFTEIAGIPVSDVITNALVVDNQEAIGSGPFRVEEIDTDRSLTLLRDDEHFLFQSEQNNVPEGFLPTNIQELFLDVRPSVSNIASAVAEDTLDGSLVGVGTEIMRSVAADAPSIDTKIRTTSRLFHVGFNVRSTPMTNHQFRAIIHRLLDRTYIVDEIFKGGAKPTLSPFYDSSYITSELDFNDPDNDPFAGESGTGDIDVEHVRDLFREAGFQYSEDGTLLSRQ